ncbi:hypothetical protein QYE76_020351 [Lolium multiflorum]|uniref:Transposase (putative) gypsy type domain-containing protein n=1 Tax=Lolium multiflorum TaxID=4521 RepID=A0AAD8R875_LOLMU|nr:hypothetical protein QYE76_020351 [Lolium multiflorum]
MGSNVTEFEIDWLYRSRRIPEGVTCRIPGDELEPDPEPGEHVVFLAHFERGFGLPASPFFREFLDFYELQPHHLPGNAIFYLSCYATFMEAYIGIRPTRSEDGQDLGCAPWPDPPEPTGSSDDLTMLEIHEHVPPLRAEAGSEFVDKLMAQGQKNKQPASDAGSSQAPPSKRFRTEPLGEKEVGVRRYGRKQMPTASG